MSRDRAPFSHPWDEALIGEVSEVIVGGTPSTSVPEFWGGQIPWMASGDVHRQHIRDVPGRITDKGLRYSNSVQVNPTAVAIALAGQGKTRGTVALTHVPICTNQSIALIKPRDLRLDPEFLYQSLIPRYEELRSRSAGGGRAGLTKSIIERVPIQLPRPVEQQGIVHVLRTLDDAIERTEVLIAKYQQIKAGLMHDVFTRGVTPDGRLRPPRSEAPDLYQQSPLGWIPKSWTAEPAGTLCASIVPGRDKPVLSRGSGLPWITIADLGATLVNESKEQLTVSRSALEFAGGRAIPEKAVIMSCVGQFGFAAIAGTELVINQQLHCFVPGARVTPRWLMHSLRLQEPYMERVATQTTIKYLNKKGCESVPVAVPPLDEQSVLVAAIESLGKREDLEVQVVGKLRFQKQGLMHDLLTGRVRVKLAELAAT
jgi:type I restriction enzyme S subunit